MTPQYLAGTTVSSDFTSHYLMSIVCDLSNDPEIYGIEKVLDWRNPHLQRRWITSPSPPSMMPLNRNKNSSVFATSEKTPTTDGNSQEKYPQIMCKWWIRTWIIHLTVTTRIYMNNGIFHYRVDLTKGWMAWSFYWWWKMVWLVSSSLAKMLRSQEASSWLRTPPRSDVVSKSSKQQIPLLKDLRILKSFVTMAIYISEDHMHDINNKHSTFSTNMDIESIVSSQSSRRVR